MAHKSPPPKRLSREAIIRAVASSTAIETGKPVRQLEKLLREGRSDKMPSHLRKLALAK